MKKLQCLAKYMFSVLVVFVAPSLMATELQGVESNTEAGHFVAKYKFDNKVDESTVTVEFLDRSVQVIIPATKMPTDKNLINVGQLGVKSVYTTREGDTGLRSKIVFDKPIDQQNMKDSVVVKADGANLKVYIKKPADVWSTAALGWTEVNAPAALEAEVQEVITAATAEVIVPEPAIVAPMAAPVAADVPVAKAGDKISNTTEAAPLRESEIPVFTSNKEAKKAAATGSGARVILSLLVIAVLGGGLFFFSKWYGRNNRKDIDNNRIRVLNQHFLGPRKSLAIIRVAGETILIGVTDQNISMIKALSLLDDEVPTNVPQNFANTLAKADQAGASKEEDKEDFVVSNIKDKISLKLKDLRPL